MASGNDIKSAAETYARFIGLMKWSTVACIAVAAFVILLISS